MFVWKWVVTGYSRCSYRAGYIYYTLSKVKSTIAMTRYARRLQYGLLTALLVGQGHGSSGQAGEDGDSQHGDEYVWRTLEASGIGEKPCSIYTGSHMMLSMITDAVK